MAPQRDPETVPTPPFHFTQPALDRTVTLESLRDAFISHVHESNQAMSLLWSMISRLSPLAEATPTLVQAANELQRQRRIMEAHQYLEEEGERSRKERLDRLNETWWYPPLARFYLVARNSWGIVIGAALVMAGRQMWDTLVATLRILFGGP